MRIHLVASQLMVAIDPVVGSVIPWLSIKNKTISGMSICTNRITYGGTNHSIILKTNAERSREDSFRRCDLGLLNECSNEQPVTPSLDIQCSTHHGGCQVRGQGCLQGYPPSSGCRIILGADRRCGWFTAIAIHCQNPAMPKKYKN